MLKKLLKDGVKPQRPMNVVRLLSFAELLEQAEVLSEAWVEAA